MAGKAQRQHRIAKLLVEHRVANQGQLAELLAEDGVGVNQATVSRDIAATPRCRGSAGIRT